MEMRSRLTGVICGARTSMLSMLLLIPLHPKPQVGAVAGDEASYETFREFFDGIVRPGTETTSTDE